MKISILPISTFSVLAGVVEVLWTKPATQ